MPPYTVHYCNYNSILVVNPVGKLRQLYTPFRVCGKQQQDNKRKWYIVDEVISSAEDGLYYLINGKVLPHHQFIIEIQF